MTFATIFITRRTKSIKVKMLEKDFEYYLNNKTELKKEFSGSFIIIQNQNILGALPSIKDVYKFLDTKKGAFLIQEVNEKPDAQTALLSL